MQDKVVSVFSFYYQIADGKISAPSIVRICQQAIVLLLILYGLTVGALARQFSRKYQIVFAILILLGLIQSKPRAL